MKIKILNSIIALILLLVITACNKVPQTEIDHAQVAITATRNVGADVYLPQEYTSLSDSLNRILLAIENKRSKWMASYKEEKEQLSNLVQMADSLQQKTEFRKDEIKTEILDNLSRIKTLLTENQKLLAEAPKGKEGTAALVAIKDELNVLNTSVENITKLVENGDFINAQDKTGAVNEKSMAINAELKEAIAKYNRAK